MEASEQPQIDEFPFEGSEPQPAGTGAVRALGDRLVIEALTISDERAAGLVRERAESGVAATETVRTMVEVGARVLDAEGTAANVDYVKRELQDGLGVLKGELGETLESGSTELAEQIAASFGADRSDSVQQQIKELVGGHLDKRVGELMGLLSADDGTNPLNRVQVRATQKLMEIEERHRNELVELRESHSTQAHSMQEQISGLRENLGRVLEKGQGDERVAEAEEAGTRKGRSFEERVHDAIETIAEGRGDIATHTGDFKGSGGTKKGDTVVEIGGADGPCLGRIVFEDKDRQLTKNEMRSELEGAMTEREADFAVLVVAGEGRIPRGQEELHEYEGDKLIVAVDPDEPDVLGLMLAYRYARLRVLMARDQALEVDAAGVRDAAESARGVLKRANTIRNALTSVEKSTAKAREGVDGMVTDVESELARIESLIAAAE